MIVTKETDYAIRILRALQDKAVHKMAQISEDQKIPPQYAYKIVRKLQEGGYVENRRGPNGGTCATCDYDQTTLLDIVTLMEGNIGISACTEPDYECPWRKENGGCSVNTTLCTLQRKFARDMQAVSLEDLFQS